MATPEPKAQQLRASDIAGQRFTLARRGLDPEEVRSFLQTLAEHASRMEGEIEWLRARGEHLESRGSSAQEAAYARLSRVFEDVVRRADEAAARVRIQTQEEAKARIQAARDEAARIVLSAQEEAGRLLAVARDEAEHMREQASENLHRAKRMAAGVHPSMPRADTPVPPPQPEPQEKPLADIWRRRDQPGPEPAVRRVPEAEDFDLKLDASLADLFGDAD